MISGGTTRGSKPDAEMVGVAACPPTGASGDAAGLGVVTGDGRGSMLRPTGGTAGTA